MWDYDNRYGVDFINKKSRLLWNSVPLIEGLDQAILDVINNPKKTQRTTDFGTLFDKRSKTVENDDNEKYNQWCAFY